jgi:hypothetical protein
VTPLKEARLRNPRHAFLSFLTFAAILLAMPRAHAQQAASPAGTVPVTTVVTVLGPKYNAPPPLGKQDIIVHSGKTRVDATGWLPAQGEHAGLELAIVIDEAVSSDIGAQFKDLATFITDQQKSTKVGLFYADNGTIQAASQFNDDHVAVAKTLRLPFGRFGAYSSIYLSLMDLIKRWPATGARREILLIADGIDRFRGDFPTSTDLESTVTRAETAGIMIHTLYSTGVGRVARNMFRSTMGQSNLSKITDATGGEAFFQGLQTPISFGPYLQQLDMVLRNQYWLTMAMPLSKKPKGDLRQFRVTTEQTNVEISSAREVFVPGTPK